MVLGQPVHTQVYSNPPFVPAEMSTFDPTTYHNAMYGTAVSKNPCAGPSGYPMFPPALPHTANLAPFNPFLCGIKSEPHNSLFGQTTDWQNSFQPLLPNSHMMGNRFNSSESDFGACFDPYYRTNNCPPVDVLNPSISMQTTVVGVELSDVKPSKPSLSPGSSTSSNVAVSTSSLPVTTSTSSTRSSASLAAAIHAANLNQLAQHFAAENSSNLQWLRGTSNTDCGFSGMNSTSMLSGKTRTRDKYRMVYTDYQRLELEKEYHFNKYITIQRKLDLSKYLGLSERQIKIWFQNRRAKERKQQTRSKDPVSPAPSCEFQEDTKMDGLSKPTVEHTSSRTPAPPLLRSDPFMDLEGSDEVTSIGRELVASCE